MTILGVIMMFVMTLVVGAIVALTPRLTPSTECFAVTVPQGACSQEPLANYLRTYTRVCAAVGIACACVWPLAYVLGILGSIESKGADVLSWLIIATTLVPIATAFALMLHFRKLVQAHKAAQGWHATDAHAVAFVGPEDFPRPLPLWVNLAYLPLVAAMVAFAIAHYADFPSQIPMRYNLGGTVVYSTSKNLATVLFPAYLTAFLGIVFTISHFGILRSKKPVDPNAPASSALAYGRFARTQSITLFAGGIFLSTAMGITFYANTLGVLSTEATLAAIMFAAIAFAGAMLAVSWRLGQVGARVGASPHNGSMPADNDEHWPLGLVYFNADDPSIVVPKRFGVGWTLNFARPGTWAIVAALALLIAGFAFGMSVLVG